MATVKIGRAAENSPTQKAKQSWYVDAEGNPTTDASKATLHIAEKGQMIMPNIAAKYGFVDGDIADKKKAQAPAENKAVTKPSDIKVADTKPKVEAKK